MPDTKGVPIGCRSGVPIQRRLTDDGELAWVPLLEGEPVGKLSLEPVPDGIKAPQSREGVLVGLTGHDDVGLGENPIRITLLVLCSLIREGCARVHRLGPLPKAFTFYGLTGKKDPSGWSSCQHLEPQRLLSSPGAGAPPPLLSLRHR